MAELSDYAENLVLDWLMTTGGATRPTAWHIALTTGTITDAHTGTNLGGSTEISGNGYSRQSATFSAASGGSTDNDALESFTASGGNWGTITDFAICDASTVGNSLVFSPLDTSRAVNDGDTLEFAAAAIVVTAA